MRGEDVEHVGNPVQSALVVQKQGELAHEQGDAVALSPVNIRLNLICEPVLVSGEYRRRES